MYLVISCVTYVYKSPERPEEDVRFPDLKLRCVVFCHVMLGTVTLQETYLPLSIELPLRLLENRLINHCVVLHYDHLMLYVS